LYAVGGNALLAVTKGLVAWFSGSSAVFSDAANSLSDTLYSLLLGLGLYVAQQPADDSHPQGHSRFEPLVSLVIALAMIAAGATALWQAVMRFREGAHSIDPGWPTAVLLGAAAVKFGMYRLFRRIGQQAHSPAIRAAARDNLSDILTSAAALAGVLGSRWYHPLLDPAAGLIVALWIGRATWHIVHENLGYLTGRGAPEELLALIARAASGIEGVHGVHRVVADYVGPQVRVDMHIDVEGTLSLSDAHDIAEEVRARVEELDEVDMVFVHVEPLPAG
jgi:cation diffusion facilitator family transporter